MSFFSGFFYSIIMERTGALAQFATLTVFCIHCACESEGVDYSLSMPSREKALFLVRQRCDLVGRTEDDFLFVHHLLKIPELTASEQCSCEWQHRLR